MHSLLVKNVFYPLHEYAKAKPTFDWLPLLERSQWLARDAILEDQNQALRSFVQYAYDHVPYYRRIMTEHGVKPREV